MTTAIDRFLARSDYARGAISTPVGNDPARLAAGLDRMRALLATLGDPQLGRPVVHVAGTKGKGSVCAMLDRILVSAGLHTGRTTSPHLHHLRERIAIGGVALDPAAFDRVLGSALDAADALDAASSAADPCTAFEVVTAAALLAFADAACDIAIIETGLGGTWDATNVVTADLAVITRLDYDHTAILGPTLADIAANKAGIIEPGRPVITCPQPPEGMAVIAATADRLGAPLLIEGHDFAARGSWRGARFSTPIGEVGPVELGLPGQHQRENAALAATAAALLAPRFVSITPLAIAQGLHRVVWPARIETIARPGEPVVIVDGAHTPASAAALAATVRDLHPTAPVTMVFGALAGKDPDAMLQALAPISARVVLTAAANPRAIPPATMLDLEVIRNLSPMSRDSVPDALAAAHVMTPPDGVIVVAGSLVIAAEARAALGLGGENAGTDGP